MIPNYCEHYQLLHDPFTSSHSYLTQPLQLLLEKMVHLSQFSVGLLVVTGPTGSGKSALVEAFSQAFSPEQEFYSIDYQPLNSGQELLQGVCEYLVLPVPPASSFGALLVALRGFIQDKTEEFAVTIVIDNAHLLDNKTLAALVSLFQSPAGQGHRRQFQFVLMAEPELVVRLDQLEMPDVLIQDLEIPIIQLEDVISLLNGRMNNADFNDKNLFIESIVAPWLLDAKGDISEILELAQKWLVNHVNNQNTGENANKESFPVIHIIAVAGLIGALTTAYLYQGVTKDKKLKNVVISVPVQSSSSSMSSSRSSVRKDPLSALAQVPISSSSPAISVPVVLPESINSSSVLSFGSKSAKSSMAFKSPNVALRPGPSRLTDDELTLLSWSSSGFTLQLLGVSNSTAAKAFILKQKNGEQLLMFSSSRQGKPWYVVIAGHFVSRNEADKAIQYLPAKQRIEKPWIRSLEGIHSEIERL